MASKCPKCHQFIDDDDICCADVKYTWKCEKCGKLSTGFVVPYGRCFLCGGDNQVIKGYRGDEPAMLKVVKEAVQYELDMYHFYRLAMERTNDEGLRGVLEELYQKEEDHLAELEEKYHVHMDPEVRKPAAAKDNVLSQWIFKDIDFEDAREHVAKIYSKAIEMERRTCEYFKARAEELAQSAEEEIYRELAAEEEEHIALLETELAQFVDDES